jgi:hypothetical protein
VGAGLESYGENTLTGLDCICHASLRSSGETSDLGRLRGGLGDGSTGVDEGCEGKEIDEGSMNEVCVVRIVTVE